MPQTAVKTRPRPELKKQLLDHLGRPLEASFPNPLAPRRYTSYDGAHIGRLNRDWIPPFRSGDMAIWDSWWVLAPRVRDLLRNSPTVIGAQHELKTNVVGSGIQTFADVVTGYDADGLPVLAEDFNDESDRLFEEWAENEADVEGKLSFHEMQELAFGEAAGMGETLLLRCQRNDPDRLVPLCFQVLEAEQLDQTRSRPPSKGVNRIARGVELDEFNRPVAYWLYNAYPWDGLTGWTGLSTRVPAERVLHPFVKFRPSQTRGISWYNPLIQPARDMDFMLGNELTAGAISSLLTAVVKRATPARGGMGMSDDASDTDDFGNELLKLGRGLVAEIGSDESVEVIESKRPGPTMAPFIKLLMQLQGQAIGMSYLGFTGDMAGASYTAARAAFLKDMAKYRVLQRWFARSYVKPVRREFTRQAAAFGLFTTLSAAQFAKQKRRWLRTTAMGPGREQLDPEKETDAAAARMRSGLSSLQEECATMGRDYRRVLQQQARAMAYAKKLGLTLDFTKGASPPKNGQVGGDPDAGNLSTTEDADDAEKQAA